MCVCRSEERSRALELCSWGFENEGLLGSFLAQLELAGSHTRAAATAVFNQRIKQAVQILQRGASSNKMPALNSTAMALAGNLDLYFFPSIKMEVDATPRMIIILVTQLFLQ